MRAYSLCYVPCKDCHHRIDWATEKACLFPASQNFCDQLGGFSFYPFLHCAHYNVPTHGYMMRAHSNSNSNSNAHPKMIACRRRTDSVAVTNKTEHGELGPAVGGIPENIAGKESQVAVLSSGQWHCR